VNFGRGGAAGFARRRNGESGMNAANNNSGKRGLKRSTGLVLLGVLVGLVAGIGAFTFFYAEGLSYMSSDSKVCVNCHIMQPQYDSWQKSSHHAVAGCADCHLPHDFFGKWIAKAENGYHHSVAFTLQNFHEPIRIKPKNSRILQATCLECHGDLVHAQTSVGSKDSQQCVHCHRSVGHGDAIGLGR
jgi:cytochrome c nitrite reductase small subunit